MAEARKLTIQPRQILGKKVNSLRRAGRLPGVVAGGHEGSTPIDTDAHAFEQSYRSWGTTTLLSLEGLGGGGVAALIHGVSRDSRTGRILHVDFQRVSLTEKTHADVPLHFTGEAAAVKTHGAVLYHATEHVRVEAFPQDMPRRIDVDLAALSEIDDAIHVRDLVVDARTVLILSEADDLVVKAMPARIEEVVTPAKVAAPVEGEAAPKVEAAGAAAAKPEAAPKVEAAPKAEKTPKK